MVQLIADGIFYLIVLSAVVSFFTPSNDTDDGTDDEEQARAWHANKVNPDSPNYRYK